MNAGLRLSDKYSPYKDSIITNLFKTIDYNVAEAIKGKPFFARYSAWDYMGKVWWDDATENWCIEIWKNHDYVCSHIAPTLEELRTEVTQVHGEH